MLKLNFIKKYQPFVIFSGYNAKNQLETNYICGIPYEFIVFKAGISSCKNALKPRAMKNFYKKTIANSHNQVNTLGVMITLLTVLLFSLNGMSKIIVY